MGTADAVPDLNQTIVSAVQARVEAEMMKALSGDAVIGQFVVAALQQQVPASDDRYDRKPPVSYLSKLLRDTIQRAAKEAVQRLVEEELPTIEAEVRKALRRNLGAIADGLAKNLTESVSKGWGVKVDLTLVTPQGSER